MSTASAMVNTTAFNVTDTDVPARSRAPAAPAHRTFTHLRADWAPA
jgi:hypothetical protein